LVVDVLDALDPHPKDGLEHLAAQVRVAHDLAEHKVVRDDEALPALFCGLCGTLRLRDGVFILDSAHGPPFSNGGPMRARTE
jgi:hypothetical protein